MTPGVGTTTRQRKKTFWTFARKWYAASGITIVAAIGFAGWAARMSEERIIRPYVCDIINNESPRLHAPIESRLHNLENDTKVIRFIIEAGTDPEVIRAAVAKAKDSTFRVR
jgi:hypothetical protein